LTKFNGLWYTNYIKIFEGELQKQLSTINSKKGIVKWQLSMLFNSSRMVKIVKDVVYSGKTPNHEAFKEFVNDFMVDHTVSDGMMNFDYMFSKEDMVVSNNVAIIIDIENKYVGDEVENDNFTMFIYNEKDDTSNEITDNDLLELNNSFREEKHWLESFINVLNIPESKKDELGVLVVSHYCGGCNALLTIHDIIETLKDNDINDTTFIENFFDLLSQEARAMGNDEEY
jgi:hypothetical protein